MNIYESRECSFDVDTIATHCGKMNTFFFRSVYKLAKLPSSLAIANIQSPVSWNSVSDNVCVWNAFEGYIRFICICELCFVVSVLPLTFTQSICPPPALSPVFFSRTCACVLVCVCVAAAEIAVSLVFCANASPAFYFLASDNELIEIVASRCRVLSNKHNLCLIRLSHSEKVFLLALCCPPSPTTSQSVRALWILNSTCLTIRLTASNWPWRD